MSRLRTILQQYVSKKQLFDTVEFFKDHKVNNLYLIKTKILPLKLINNNLIGGKEYDLNLKINHQSYQVHIDEYSDTLDKNFRTVNFIKFISKI